MKTKKIIVLFLFVCSITIHGFYSYFPNINVIEDTYIYRLDTSDSWNLPFKIIIDGNWSQTRDTYDWCSGSGTSNEPYTIENITMDGQLTGGSLEIRNTNDFFIIKNSAFLNTPNGIILYNVANGSINHCTFLNNTGNALALRYCEYITIFNNTFETDNNYILSYGINLQDYCSNILIFKNRFIIHGTVILMMDHCDDNIVRENTFDNPYMGSSFRISDYSDNNHIINNTFNRITLEILESQFNNVLNNTFVPIDSSPTIYLRNSIYSSIINNIIKATIYHYHNGIHLRTGSDSNYIYHNTISGAVKSIWLEGSDNNTISSNTLRNSVDIGIHITGNDNKVFYNVLEQNSINAIDDGYDTKWNETTSGNYWEDYNGVDANDDGIGDTPYNITSTLSRPDSQDYLPVWYTIPQITINSPANDSHWNIEPTLDLIVTDDTLNCTWYNVSDQREFLQSGVAENLRADIWSSLPEGPFLIEFFANDSININDENKYVLTKDTIAPLLQVISPLENSVHSNNLPEFNLSVSDANLYLTWYTLNNQTEMHYINSSGTIDQIAWNNLLNGDITITFVASDKAGNVVSHTIHVVKSTPPNISSFDLFILIGISLGIVVFLSLTLKRRIIKIEN